MINQSRCKLISTSHQSTIVLVNCYNKCANWTILQFALWSSRRYTYNYASEWEIELKKGILLCTSIARMDEEEDIFFFWKDKEEDISCHQMEHRHRRTGQAAPKGRKVEKFRSLTPRISDLHINSRGELELKIQLKYCIFFIEWLDILINPICILIRYLLECTDTTAKKQDKDAQYARMRSNNRII